MKAVKQALKSSQKAITRWYKINFIMMLGNEIG